LLALRWGIQQVVALTAVFSIIMCFYLAWRLWDGITVKEIWPMILGAVVGVPIGVTALTELDPRYLKGSLGIFLLVYALWSLLGREGSGSQISRRWALPVGVGAGVLSGAFNTGGPPVVLYGTERQWSPNAFRGNVQGFFAPCATFTLCLFIYKGVVTEESLIWNAKLLPFLIVGMVLGDRLADSVQPGPFRRILLISLLVVGVIFLRAFFLPAPL
jgi:uncharacterized membrane protein YfcA